MNMEGRGDMLIAICFSLLNADCISLNANCNLPHPYCKFCDQSCFCLVTTTNRVKKKKTKATFDVFVFIINAVC